LRCRRRRDREVWPSFRAAGEFKRTDKRRPVERAIRGEIFVGVPERTVVARIDAQRSVVSPSRETAGLRTRTFDQAGLGSHRARRITRRPAGVTDSWMDRSARRAVAESNVSRSIHRGAAHPAVNSICRTEGSLLKHTERACSRYRRAQFIPADSHCRCRADGVVHDQCLMVREHSKRQTIHQAVTQ